jgi:NAD+ kinase
MNYQEPDTVSAFFSGGPGPLDPGQAQRVGKRSKRPRRVVVMAYQGSSDAELISVGIEDFLRQAGVEEIARGLFRDPELEARVTAGDFDILIALGGDGTMLRAAHLCAQPRIPILGINVGRLGFLAEVQGSDWREGIASLVAGHFRVENRLALVAEHRRGAEIISHSLVVNDVVICRGAVVRPIRIQASVDGYTLTTYVADGVIASTPTGSTAYALAAGGPIMPPELRNILLIPVAPHLTMDRAIILSEGSSVELTAYTDHEAVMSVDGRPAEPLQDGDRVLVKASEHTVRFVRFQDPGYFYRNITAYMEQNPSARVHS